MSESSASEQFDIAFMEIIISIPDEKRKKQLQEIHRKFAEISFRAETARGTLDCIKKQYDQADPRLLTGRDQSILELIEQFELMFPSVIQKKKVTPRQGEQTLS